MFYILGSDQKEYGPITEADLRAWVAEKRINGSTMTRRPEEKGWAKLSSYPEFRSLFFPPEPPREDPAVLESRILSKEIPISIGDDVRNGFEIYKNNFAGVAVATLLVILAQSAVGYVPCLGLILSPAIGGILHGGLYSFILKVIRGEKAEIGDAFVGFQRNTKQLAIGGLVSIGVPLLLFLVIVLISFIPVIIAGAGLTALQEDPGMLIRGLGLLSFLGIFVAIVAVSLLSMLWIFTPILIIDKGLDFWPAMELSRKVVMRSFFPTLGLALIAGIIGASGICLLGVGIFFTAPIMFCIVAWTYEQIFGTTRSTLVRA